MYNKLFTKILDSSVWLEPHATRIVWLTLLAVMDEDGMCQFASVVNLARRAIVTTEEAGAALKVLESPDPHSSDPENDGRRIERVPGGWIVLNAVKYKSIVSGSESRRLARERAQRYRDKKFQDGDKPTVGGFVYYARSYDRMKIGFSRNPWSRISELNLATPGITLVAKEIGDFSLEKQRHTQFSHLRIEGEWFRIEADLEQFVASLVVSANVTTEHRSNSVVTQSYSETETETETETKAHTPRASNLNVVMPSKQQSREPTQEWGQEQLIEEIAIASPAGVANSWTPLSLRGSSMALGPIVNAVILEAKEQGITEREAGLYLLRQVRSVTEAAMREPNWKRYWTQKRMVGFYQCVEYRDLEKFTQAATGGSNGAGKRGKTDGNGAAFRDYLGETSPHESHRNGAGDPREHSGARHEQTGGDSGIRGGDGGSQPAGVHPRVQPGTVREHGVLPYPGSTKAAQWPN
jgi:hypothetical protein